MFKLGVGMIDANMLGACYEAKGGCLRCVGMVGGKDVEMLDNGIISVLIS
jgi:hypothetical protein